MAELQDLRGTLKALADSGGSAKVSFYYVGDDGIALRTGAIHVDRGQYAYLDHQKLPPQQAVDSIVTLKLVKIAVLDMAAVSPDPSLTAVALADLVGSLVAPVAPAPAPAPAAPPAAAAPQPPPAAPAAAPSAPAIDVKGEALRLLEPLFGVSATRKIEEFAVAHPPQQVPAEFIQQCQKHASIMLGAAKAEALFRPVLDALASAGHPGR